MNNSFQQTVNNMLKTIVQMESAEVIVSFHIILNEKKHFIQVYIDEMKDGFYNISINLSSKVKANLYKYLQFD